MGKPNIQKLIEINEKIKNLKAVKCRITHERVQINFKTNLPVTHYTGEKIYERIGFCSKQLRAERISCSHSMAPDILHEALDILDQESERVIGLRNDLMDTIFQIHQLDHQKGDAEKDLAILIEKKLNESNGSTVAEINSAKETIKKIENEHDQRVDKIAGIKDQIVFELERAINPKSKI